VLVWGAVLTRELPGASLHFKKFQRLWEY